MNRIKKYYKNILKHINTLPIITTI